MRREIVTAAAITSLLFAGTVARNGNGDEPLDAAGPTPPRVITVRVVGVDDTPIPGVKIRASVWTKQAFPANRDFFTDPEGKAAISLPASLDILRLFAAKPGHIGMFANWDKNMTPDGHLIPETFTFRLEKGSTIGGTVVDEDGKPIEGVRISAMLEIDPRRSDGKWPTWNSWLTNEDAHCVTRADGRWSLDNVPPADVEVALMLQHPRFVSDYGWSRLKQADIKMPSLRNHSARLVMQRGIAVTGRVKGPAGEPISNAVVVWGDRPYFTPGSQEVRTDEAGKFELPPLLGDPKNSVQDPLPVLVVAPGFAPQQQKVDLREGAAMDFTLKPGKTIRLQFSDVDGKPIPEVNVGIIGWRQTQALYNSRHPNAIETAIPLRANASGIYEWTWAPDDEVVYSFSKEGYSAVQRQRIAPAEGAVSVVLHRTPDGQ
jgi:hypothetical protein